MDINSFFSNFRELLNSFFLKKEKKFKSFFEKKRKKNLKNFSFSGQIFFYRKQRQNWPSEPPFSPFKYFSII